MSRTPDEGRRREILEACVDYVCRHGLADLSLRPLAKAVGSSPRVLLHYFKSKENLVVEIVLHGRARQQAMMARLKLTDLAPREVVRKLWREWSKPEWEALTRLSFEIYALALQDRARFPGYLDRSVNEWLRALEKCAQAPGRSRRDARSLATLLVAGFRGFLLDLVATHDRTRIDRAVERWISLVYAPIKGPRSGATIFIFITVLIDMVTFGMIGPVLPKLIASFVGNNYAFAAEIIGLFATVWALMQFFCSPLLGMLSDRVGRRPVILISNAVAVVDYAVMALAPNLWWLFAGRILSGIATANMATAGAYIADVTPAEKRASAFGLIGSAFGLGFVLGPAIGGLVGTINPRLTFWAAAAFALINTLYGIFVLPESLSSERHTKRLEWKRANPIGSLKLLRSHHELWGLTWVNLITYIGHEVLPNVWVIYCIAAFGWSTGSIGLTLALVGTIAAINQATMIRPVVARLGERRVLLASLVVAALGLALMGINNGFVFLLAAVIISLPMYQASSQALMTRRVKASEQGELQGALGSVRGLSMLIGPAIFTLTFAQFAGPWRGLGLIGAPWYLAATLYGIAFCVAWRITSHADDVVLPVESIPPLYAES